jgi:hypothetical protein
MSIGEPAIHFAGIALPVPGKESGNDDLRAHPWLWVANRFRSGYGALCGTRRMTTFALRSDQRSDRFSLGSNAQERPPLQIKVRSELKVSVGEA